MKTPPSAAALLFIIVAASKSIAGAVKLAQSDGDLPAHLVIGQRILTGAGIPASSIASYTDVADRFVAHAWLSETLFAVLHRIGGLPLLAVLTGLVIALTHTLVVLFLRSRGVDPRWAVVAGLMSLALGASHWLTRPHMFSILGAALTLLLLESSARRKLWWFAVLFAVWANLHGGWLFGLVLIGIYAVGDWIEARISGDSEWQVRSLGHAKAFAAAGVATLLNPYGPRLHLEVAEAVTSPLLAANIAEYQSPNFHEVANLPFLLGLGIILAILAHSRRRMPVTWTVVLLVSVAFSLRSFRNIALLGVTAWPLVAVHASRSWAGWNPALFRDFARLDRSARTFPWVLAATALLLALGLNRGRVGPAVLIKDRFDPGIFPVAAVDSARSAGLRGRVFHPWTWGGYLMKEWPEARLHVDPLRFNAATIDSYTRIETLRPDWQDELQRWAVDVVLLKREAPLGVALRSAPGWYLWYEDSTAVVFLPANPHPARDSTDATTSYRNGAGNQRGTGPSLGRRSTAMVTGM